jgi:uncharacterized protein YvpB
MFVNSVHSEEKKEVVALVQEDFRPEITASRIPHHEREKFPHWVVVTGFDERFVYIHDPYVDYESGKNTVDCMNLPVAKDKFARMARYGRSGYKACLILYPPQVKTCPKT